MKYQKEIKKFIGTATYDNYGGGYIWGKSPNNTEMVAQVDDIPNETEVVNNVLSIRGWGAIQNMFPNVDSAEDFQNEIGRFIAEAINEKLEKL